MKDVSLWKVSIEGGDPTLVSDKRAYNISISPDQTKFAHFTRIGEKIIIGIKSFPGFEALQEFAPPAGYFAGRDVVWTKDGSSLIYAVEDSNLVGNLWKQPLGGGEPMKLTNYNSEEIFNFGFSPDGSRLAIIRGSWNHDLVLVKGFRNN